MSVYVVVHNDAPDGSVYVRGIYTTSALAETARFMDEVAQYRQTHNEWCCGVEVWAVADTLPEVMHGPEKPYDGPNEQLVPDFVWDQMLRGFAAGTTNIYRDIVKAGRP